MLHHYTSLETLALILKSRKIRFNRLDRVDDVSESRTFGVHTMAPFLFVSCWTESDEESIPLWNMYTGNMRGVRISFPGKPFHFRKIPAHNDLWLSVEGEVESPLTLEQQFADNYFVVPTFLDKSKFGSKVDYVDDIQDMYKDAVTFTPNSNGTFQIATKSPNNLAVHKAKVWSFQREYRFALYALPTPGPAKDFSKDTENFVNHMSTCLYHGQGPDIDFIDVDICPTMLQSMSVTLGPLATLAEQIIVESLLQELCGHKNVRHSDLHGTIRARN